MLLTGSGEVISGGAGGPGEAGGGCPAGVDGPDGLSASIVGGTLLHSNVVFSGLVDGPANQVVPPDPVLRADGSGTPGTTLTYTVLGVPGDQARLRLGRRLVVEDVPGVFEDRLTTPLRSYLFGTLPASGARRVAARVRAGRAGQHDEPGRRNAPHAERAGGDPLSDPDRGGGWSAEIPAPPRQVVLAS